MGVKFVLATVAVVVLPVSAAGAQIAGTSQAIAETATPAPFVLAAGTPVIVALDQDLSSKTSKVGDPFKVTVVYDVVDRGVVVIPKGTTGSGEVTFSTDKGGFGRAGIIGIALRYLDLDGKQVLLDGRYREEGKDNGAAAGAVVFMVGIFGAVVHGKSSTIPMGRELKAHTGDDIPFTTGAPSLATVPPVGAVLTPAATAPATGQPTANK